MMIEVETGLYIGAACDIGDVERLNQLGITRVLTVDSQAAHLPEFIRTKFVQAFDDSSTDLLSRFDECHQFIEAGKGASSSVLVHCHAGQSRSAAIVTAYLMKTHKLSLEEAQCTLLRIKPDVRINQDFLDQLALYESMGCELDATTSLYKQFRLQKVTERYPELQTVPKEVFAADPGQMQTSETVYRCRKCRRVLFRGSSILSHCVGSGPVSFSHKKCERDSQVSTAGGRAQCTSLFIEPVQWMEEALLGVMDGQLLCPKCNSKLGSFNWYGEQCSCGKWVTPAFQMHKSRVDEIKPVSISALR
ncbi:dual specificity protein phosphatase 12 [Denticeps clupeoides]|uniref:Dual specificity protein phosphatase 12 n=1 Tax=Denticeps clupeoides TaxID=299321 RepID=A0AAY4CVY1_9TELE|nr:dual specificity protein phosphatase 12 [Denticeps clupeoides]